jgi:hypothetical protein
VSPAVEALAGGLWRRLRDVVLAERRLEQFAFAPGAAAPADRLAALGQDDAALAALALDMTLRALAAAADGVNYRLLAAVGDEPVSLDEVARTLGLPPLAVSERIGALAQVGLVARDLERDAIVGTEAGRGALLLVRSVGAALHARGRAEVPSLL